MTCVCPEGWISSEEEPDTEHVTAGGWDSHGEQRFLLHCRSGCSCALQDHLLSQAAVALSDSLTLKLQLGSWIWKMIFVLNSK
jgi:hypothetical protein